MDWRLLNSEEEFAAIIERSHSVPQVIFKHSTRCGTSSLIKNRLERDSEENSIEFNLLNVIAHRALSRRVAESLKVWHESPQVLVIMNGECIMDESHLSINMEEIKQIAIL